VCLQVATKTVTCKHTLRNEKKKEEEVEEAETFHVTFGFDSFKGVK